MQRQQVMARVIVVIHHRQEVARLRPLSKAAVRAA
jgi:hypothetical protein